MEILFANQTSSKAHIILYPKCIKRPYNSTGKKSTQSYSKWAENLYRYFSKEDIQKANITNHQESANQNHNEITSHISQNGYHQEVQ